jgi:hypothetical protein
MKSSIALFSLLFSINTFACAEQVQKQISEVNQAQDYSIEIMDTTVTSLKNISLISDYLYVADEAAILNPETAVYHAESSAMGCYGFEYVLFDKKDCRLLAFGGGYCD